MLITQISKQKKGRKRYNIFLDEEFYCGMYDDTILKFGLARGDEISEKKINEIISFDEYIYGKKIAFDYLSYRIRTVSEIRKKLRTKNISDNSIEKVLNHLAELKLTNDEEFAKQLINEKVKRKPAGKKVLMQKLYEKGVPKDIVENALNKKFEEIDERQMVKTLFMKYSVKLKGLDKNEKKKKAFDYMARKGFDFDIIKEVINESIIN